MRAAAILANKAALVCLVQAIMFNIKDEKRTRKGVMFLLYLGSKQLCALKKLYR